MARPVIERIYAAALEAADPRRAVHDAIESSDAIASAPSIVVVAIGKAAVTMAQGAIEALGDRISRGVAITKDDHSQGIVLPRFEIYEASHPIPDERGVKATQRAIEIVEECRADDLVLALISGGGSALFEAPEPPVTLADMASVTGQLLRAGAAIEELNAVRTPLSQVKGGGFISRVRESKVVTLIVSDVLGNNPRVIASGPTMPGQRDTATARKVLERFGLWLSVPQSIREVLLRSDVSSANPSTGSSLSIIADNRSAVEAARSEAEALGLKPSVMWRDRTGEAREQAHLWVELCREAGPDTDCLIGGGELTVTVSGEGIGGRNTEFVLAAAFELQTLGDSEWIITSVATDGQDGPTGMAGGFLDAESVQELIEGGVDPRSALAENDSLAPLRLAGGVIDPGPTGTNVNDLFLAIRKSALAR